MITYATNPAPSAGQEKPFGPYSTNDAARKAITIPANAAIKW
jgi:hypothetical protein